MNKTRKEFEGLKEEVKACGQNQQCLDKVTIKLQKDFEILPYGIYRSFNLMLIKTQSLNNVLENFCIKNYDDFRAKGSKIFNGIVNCIKTKL